MSTLEFSDEIFIIDDDPAHKDRLSSLFRAERYRVINFEAREALTAAKLRGPACLIICIHTRDRAELDIFGQIKLIDGPTIIMADNATIPMAVEAIKGGASAFLELPYDPASIVMLVREHIEAWKLVRESNHRTNVDMLSFPGAEQLTQRQRQVLAEITTVASNKEAGRNLGLSPRTIEAHRARIMLKLGVKSSSELFQLVLGNARKDNYS